MRFLTSDEQLAVLQLLWPAAGGSGDGGDDEQRWRKECFELPRLATGSPFSLGLRQAHGGPCGVLAAVQAELLRLALFDRRGTNGGKESEDSGENDALQKLLAQVTRAGEDAQLELLVEALASVLMRCGRRESGGVAAARQFAVHLVVRSDVGAGEDAAYCEEVVVATDRRDPALLHTVRERLDAFRSPHGVMNFVFSVVRTKSVAAIRAEMDDPGVALTGQFGHCSQELLNLLLTGYAVSNVFDGSVPLGGTGGGGAADDATGLMLRGVPERACVGYLTQLEALRYCQVGSYYKSPMHPVWVVGSASHFSVCFGLDPAICEESTCEMLFQRVHRVFKSFDAQETGFMDIAVLAESLRQLGVSREILSSEYWMARLLGQLEVAGAGIVLWDEYWKVVSVLLHTGDLELALSGKYERASDDGAAAADGSAQQQAEGQQQRPRSDSDLARELQAQFDSEASGSGPGAVAATSSSSSIAATPLSPAPPPQNQSKSTVAPPSSSPPAAAEEESFDLYYYNGLSSSGANGRRPQLAKCRVTIPKVVNFIGKSVPIFETGTGGGYASPPLEEIIKTKWTGARIDWLGQPVPSVD